MHSKQLESVFKLESKERYGYLIRKVADFEQIFLIAYKKGDYVTCGTDGSKCIPVWPELEFAKEFLNSDWKKFKVVSVELDDFLEWLDKLESESYLIGGFPNQELNSIVVTPFDMKNHLIHECQQYE